MQDKRFHSVRLDKEKCSVFDFYQYWRNVEDQDVQKCLALLTFLPMEEVRRLGSLPGEQINEAKRVLAYTLTSQVHGEEEAQKAQTAAQALFAGGTDLSNIPSCELSSEQIEGSGLRMPDLLVLSNLAKSKSDARRLIADGGVFVGDKKVDSPNYVLNVSDLEGDGMIIRKGKKTYCRIRKA